MLKPLLRFLNNQSLPNNMGLCLMGSVLAVIGVGILAASGGEPGPALLAFFLSSLVFFTLSAVCFGFVLARFGADFFVRLFLPAAKNDGPLPIYSVPEGDRRAGEFRKAFVALEEIAMEHPQELRAYVEMIDIALSDMHDPTLADSIFVRGQEILKPQLRRKLERSYELLKERGAEESVELQTIAVDPEDYRD